MRLVWIFVPLQMNISPLNLVIVLMHAPFFLQLKAGETAAVIARELAEQTKRNLQAGDITYTVKAMVQLVDLLDVQLRNLTPGGKDSAARSLNKVLGKKAL